MHTHPNFRTLPLALQDHTEYQTAQLAGNSVHVDRLFLLKHMPRLVDHLNYRIIDVSTVAELARWVGWDRVGHNRVG